MSPPGPELALPIPDAVRMSAVHLGGVQGLAAGQRGLELRFSAVGVQILRLDTQTWVGTMPWTEVRSVQLPRSLSVRRGAPRIQITTHGGQARFALPGLKPRQVRDHLAPLLADRSGRR